MRKRTNVIIIIVLAIILLLEIVLVKLGVFNTVDDFIYSHVSKIINNTNTTIFKSFSFLGTEIFIILFCLVCILLKKSRGVAISVVVLTSTLLNQAIKIVIRRPRPDINPIVMEKSFSFPSGHTMIMVVIGGILIYLLWQKRGSNTKCNTLCITKIISTILICLIATTVMFSRIYLGVHYFSDIIGGITSGLLFLFISYYYYNFKYKVPYYPGKKK